MPVCYIWVKQLPPQTYFILVKITKFLLFTIYLEAFLCTSKVFPLKVDIYLSLHSLDGKRRMNYSSQYRFSCPVVAENVKCDVLFCFFF